jgi:hypothetical protein
VYEANGALAMDDYVPLLNNGQQGAWSLELQLFGKNAGGGSLLLKGQWQAGASGRSAGHGLAMVAGANFPVFLLMQADVSTLSRVTLTIPGSVNIQMIQYGENLEQH